MVIAFDYDGVADDERIQALIRALVSERNEVWIVTMRKENEHNINILKPLLDKVLLTKYNIIFCNDKPKMEMLAMINADIYIDNISTEFQNIINHTKIIPLLWQS